MHFSQDLETKVEMNKCCFLYTFLLECAFQRKFIFQQMFPLLCAGMVQGVNTEVESKPRRENLANLPFIVIFKMTFEERQ